MDRDIDTTLREALRRADALRREGRAGEAMECCLAELAPVEMPDGRACLTTARCAHAAGDAGSAVRWLLRVVDAGDDLLAWQSAASMLATLEPDRTVARRTARVAILGSYTTGQLATLLPLAALRCGASVEIYEAGYDQFRQEILDPSSGLYAFEPDVVVLAVHAGALGLPEYSDEPDQAVADELAGWRQLWEALARRTAARLVMHNFVGPPEVPLGHLSARLPGSRHAMIQRLNAALGAAAGTSVSIVDCQRVAAAVGTRRWFDDKYWHVAKQAVALPALPALARHTAAVMAADLGLGRKCLVLDLDNTLWGGVIGEDGLSGIQLGSGPAGEAFVAFQQYILQLQRKGVILAVCSKNNDADARSPFLEHPDMVLSLEDIAMFVANWEPKPQNIRGIAEGLNIGLDALVFVDDNPVEREAVRQMAPEVDVVTLPADPAGYTRALGDYLLFETSSLTAEDARRTEQYRARAEIARLQTSAGSIDDFYRSLQMQAIVAPFDELNLPRIVQLIGKSNQFNLTTRRHTLAAVRRFMDDGDCAHLYLRLRDRFTDHGLVSLLIAFRDGDVLEIDTWLMSCRVIGRTVEAEMLSHLCREAAARGCTSLGGTYVPSAKNAMVADVYGRLGFRRVAEEDGTTRWVYDLAASGPIESQFIDAWEIACDAA